MSKANKWIDALMKDERSILASQAKPKERVLTVSPSLNWALGGGFYEGYTTCLYGPNQGGKTLTANLAAAAIQRKYEDGIFLNISAEMRDPSPERLRTLGVDPDRYITRYANTVHDIADWITCTDSSFTNSDGSKGPPGLLYMLREGAPIKGFMIDSIAAIRPPQEMKLESFEDKTMMALAGILPPIFRAILDPIRKFSLMAILIQQVRQNPNQDEVKYQNKKYIVPGGESLGHHCEHMCLVERLVTKDSKILDPELQSISERSLQLGHTIRISVQKANMDKSFRDAEFKIDYDRGIVEQDLEIVKMATNLGILRHPLNENQKPINNQWVFDNGIIQKKWVGLQNAIDEIRGSTELQAAILTEAYKI